MREPNFDELREERASSAWQPLAACLPTGSDGGRGARLAPSPIVGLDHNAGQSRGLATDGSTVKWPTPRLGVYGGVQLQFTAGR
jgi:hypothetical protein